MKKMFKDLLDIENPVLTETLAPKLAPFAKIVYLIGLVVMAISCFRLIGNLLSGTNFSIFLFDLLMLVASFAIFRMFCEYLAAAKSNK